MTVREMKGSLELVIVDGVTPRPKNLNGEEKILSQNDKYELHFLE